MKSLINYLLSVSFIILVMIFFASCSIGGGNKEVLTEKIQYDVPVNNNDPQLDWWINNIEGSRREPFLKRIMEMAEKGDVRVYDYFNSSLTSAQLQAQITDTIYRTLVRTYPPYEEYDTMVVSAISYQDISKIRFLEEWSYKPGTLEIDKKVLAIGPVVQFKVAGESFNRLLFWIYFDERYPVK